MKFLAPLVSAGKVKMFLFNFKNFHSKKPKKPLEGLLLARVVQVEGGTT